MATQASLRTLNDPLAETLGYQLRRSSLVYLMHLTDAVEELGLRLTEATFLIFVGANPACNQAEISRALGVKRTNMVPTANRLVEIGLIARKAADGRTNALFLTPDGERTHAVLREALARCEAKFFGGIDPDVQALLVKTLHDVRAKAGD